MDPQQEIEPYLKAAESAGVRIEYVVDTHVHADHLSGGRKLAEAAGARYVLHQGAGARYDFFGVQEGDVLELGNVLVRVLHTPGHTPEHISLLVTDKTRGPEPWCVLTGHTLMVGDLGRTELATSPEEGARNLFESARKLAALPEYLEVYPGAFAGSVCGRGLSGKPASTIGFERRFNRALQLDQKDAFVEYMLREIPPKPPRADQVRAVNLGLASSLE